MPRLTRPLLKDIYRKLYRRFGPQYWWPGRSRFEIIVGAILTQNTNWINVEKAIRNLRQERCLSLTAVNQLSTSQLSSLIRPAGYFNVKAKRLKNFVGYVVKNYRGSLSKMSKRPARELRSELLKINGIGPETADSILLYAFNKPIFVIDAYTKRILHRHGWVSAQVDYHDLQKEMMTNLQADTQMFNEYHALIVRLAKEHCKTRPQCDSCPLNTYPVVN